MKKKKPAKAKKTSVLPEVTLRQVASEIVADIYAEVERASGRRLDDVARRLESLHGEFSAVTLRIVEVERRLVACQRPEPTTWLGRLHRRKWFCLPWCRYSR